MVKVLDIAVLAGVGIAGYFLVTKGSEVLKSFTDSLTAPFAAAAGATSYVFNLPGQAAGAVSTYINSFQETPQQKSARLATDTVSVVSNANKNAGFVTNTSQITLQPSATPDVDKIITTPQFGYSISVGDTKSSLFGSAATKSIKTGTGTTPITVASPTSQITSVPYLTPAQNKTVSKIPDFFSVPVVQGKFN